MKKFFNFISYFIAYIFAGCPICYSTKTIKMISGNLRFCTNCKNQYDVRIWNE